MEDTLFLQRLIKIAGGFFPDDFSQTTMSTDLPGFWAPDQANSPNFLDMTLFFYTVEAEFDLNEFTNLETATCRTFGDVVRLVQQKLAISAS